MTQITNLSRIQMGDAAATLVSIGIAMHYGASMPEALYKVEMPFGQGHAASCLRRLQDEFGRPADCM